MTKNNFLNKFSKCFSISKGDHHSSLTTQFGICAVCMLAFAVSMGTAVVSISKALVLLFFSLHLISGGLQEVKKVSLGIPTIIMAIGLALVWLLLSNFWTIAPKTDALRAAYEHGRFIWLPIFYILMRDNSGARKVLLSFGVGQALIVLLSLLLAMGVPVPFTKHNTGDEFGVVFTYHLEQPIMSTILLSLIWVYRAALAKRVGMGVVYVACIWIIVDVMFVLRGRAGYVVMLLLLAVELFRKLPLNIRWLCFVGPLLFGLLVYDSSPAVQRKVDEVVNQVQYFSKTSFVTSPGIRIEMWKRAVLGIQESPIFGHGLGSFPQVYKLEGGWLTERVYQPHQQYLLWCSDLGLVGLVLFISIFVAIWRDARYLEVTHKRMLFNVVTISLVLGFMISPYYGVGTGELFLLLIAACLRAGAID